MLAAIILGVALLSPGGIGAQQQNTPVKSPILTIESERLFTDSAFGKRIAGDIEAESAVLAAENRRMEADLTAEEKELAEKRSTMEPDAFRVLADTFDEKVKKIRETQIAKARDLTQRLDAARVQFVQTARPVLEALMRDSGAAVILERASVFLSANATDITDLAVDRIDAVLGDGTAILPKVQD